MASPTQWTWVWVNSRCWWWIGRSGVLQFMGKQRVGHNWATELNTYTHMHTYIHTFICTHTYIHTHACTHINTYTYSGMLLHHKKRQKPCHLWQHGLESITLTEINQKDKYCIISLTCDSEKPILIDTKSRMVVAKSWTMGKMRKDVGQRLQT